MRNTFLPLDANKILGIPISFNGQADELCWVCSKDGVLYVKDFYSVALKSIDFAAYSRGSDPLWNKIWKLKVPPKVRDFVCVLVDACLGCKSSMQCEDLSQPSIPRNVIAKQTQNTHETVI